MKAWEDLEKEVSLYWTGDENNPVSHWYMEHGCKIEKFVSDGRIEIKNVMMAGDHYVSIDADQYAVFEDEGWLAGCYNVCIDVYRERLSRVSKHNMANEDIRIRVENLNKKLARYVELKEYLK